MLSPRELASDSLPNKNWINERLTFTHGYGIAAGPVNQVTPEGLPVLFVKDLPPKSEVKELEVTRPEVYYGEIPNEYVIVKTKSKELITPKVKRMSIATIQEKAALKSILLCGVCCMRYVLVLSNYFYPVILQRKAVSFITVI